MNWLWLTFQQATSWLDKLTDRNAVWGMLFAVQPAPILDSSPSTLGKSSVKLENADYNYWTAYYANHFLCTFQSSHSNISFCQAIHSQAILYGCYPTKPWFRQLGKYTTKEIARKRDLKKKELVAELEKSKGRVLHELYIFQVTLDFYDISLI